MTSSLSARFTTKPLQQIEHRFQNLSPPLQKKALVSSAVLVVAAVALEGLMTYSINAGTSRLNKQAGIYATTLNGKPDDYVKEAASKWSAETSRTSPIEPFVKPEVLDFLPILFSRAALKHYNQAQENFEQEQRLFNETEQRVNKAWDALKCISNFQAALESCAIDIRTILGLSAEARANFTPEKQAGIISNSYKVFRLATDFIKACDGSITADPTAEEVMQRLKELSEVFPNAKELLDKASSSCEIIAKPSPEHLVTFRRRFNLDARCSSRCYSCKCSTF
ncbi:MAG: hypothetical protein L7U87_03775 [Chlamydiales bacterium]|nr:hypothetical protein [Chlamydiales bacterium]